MGEAVSNSPSRTVTSFPSVLVLRNVGFAVAVDIGDTMSLIGTFAYFYERAGEFKISFTIAKDH
jgi:hypothetical protein